MVSTVSPAQTYSLEAYRHLEEVAQERHEYHNGQVIPMTGGTIDHSQISGNLFLLLSLGLKHTAFKAYNSDLRVWIPTHQRGVYPDITVIQGAPQFNDDRRDEILNPHLIVEVLSNTTEAYDRGDKFRYYRSIPSFQDYLLVSQRQAAIDYYRLEADQWLLTAYQGLDATLVLRSNSLVLPLADIYEGSSLTEVG
ncbi:Uma2 family endonuclease [Prochlorothrix hollandica]|uniref:Putative restriction endonuclease domain-containing protein n=1 Tax=Prochlorothrix hollandica PCC 9006 = CALU 1027 TaxID=317619 RepID=A0A0M2PUY2_PROHO|nr:Uma2 family endonuclease [Prochlorothrix hollandica]KKI99929.1 hypothetical protein PROH_09010 [Prochlorothrix hollandica PCC 9006 = CALU 1027]